MRRRITAVAVLAAMFTVLLVGTAFAGEITGNGKSTPIRSGVAASICAFSGQNDTWDGEQPDEEGFSRTQNWGQLPKEFRAGIRSGDIVIEHVAPPNVACNPSGSR